MLPEIITFNKSMQLRLEEYQQLLDTIETPCSEVMEVWASIFEDLVVINPNWKALWMLSEKNCKKYELIFPTAVIVNVIHFNWSLLTANVKVIAVQEDIIIPSMIDVPIIELHPIKVQDFDETDLRDIEDWLDKCRYFFNNLWYPWDGKFDVTIADWCESHLKNRLKMQYDIKNGVFDKAIANYLKLLLSEAQNINAFSNNNNSEMDDGRLSVVKKYIRRKMLKTELDLFEEPDLRYGMILLKRKEKRFRNSNEIIENPEVKFIWTNGNCKTLIEYLKIAKSMVDEKAPVKVCGSLQEAFDSSNTNDTVLIPPGLHEMTMLRGIENGGIIKGFNEAETFIQSDPSTLTRAILFECFGCIELENLTISNLNGILLQVFQGNVKIANCKLVSKENSTASRGVVVVSGSKVFIEKCQFQGFGTAVTVQGKANASILDSEIYNCHEGIKVMENAMLSLHQVEITSCSTYGIRVELSKVDLEDSLVGNLNLLEENDLNCEIKASCVMFDNNKKGNVIVKNSEKALNLEEFSESDDSEEIILISDDNVSINNDSINDVQVALESTL